MSKNYRSIEWKTAVCLVFSVFLHAGLIYYVASTQFGGGSPGVNKAGEAAPVEFQTITPIPVSGETKETKEEVKVETPKVEPAKQKEVVSAKPEPKIDVSRPENPPKKETSELPEPRAKLARVLPKKEITAPRDNKSPVEIAKNDDPEPQIEKEEMQEVMPVEKVESMNVEKEVAHEKAVREELVEKIMKDEPNPEQLKIENGSPKIVEEQPATPAPEQPKVETEPAPIAAVESRSTSTAAPSQPTKGDAKTAVAPIGNGKQLPIKNDYELKAMPGNKDPQYSSGDRLARRQGEVKFMAEVAADGSISNIRILKSSGHRSLDLAAYSAFKNYRYYPGQQSYVVKSFVFTLKGPAQALPSRLGTRTQAAN